MNGNIEKVTLKLDELGVSYELMRHPAVYTMEEMDALGIFTKGVVPKNLFLRDAKGHRHFLVTMIGERKADMVSLQEKIGCTRLSFASPERLNKYFGVEHGMVSPLGVINDSDAEVEVFFDSGLRGLPCVGVHPNDNTATVWLSFDDLLKVVRANGNEVHFLDLG